MILFLVRKYFVHVFFLTLGLGALPAFFSAVPFRDTLLSALLWAGFFANATVYIEFKRQGLWPLYDNLRLSRLPLLGSLAATILLIYLGLRAWMI